MFEALVVHVGFIMSSLACVLFGGAVCSYTLIKGDRGRIVNWFMNTSFGVAYGWRLFERRVFKKQEEEKA